MKDFRCFLLLFLVGLFLFPLRAEDQKKSQREKNTLKQDQGIVGTNEKIAGSSIPSENAEEINPHTLRNIAFQELNPDFSFPARKARYFYEGSSQGNKVCLSFDDGPHPKYTPQILGILKEKKVKATFFLTGENARYYPHLVRAIMASGCEVGNHSYSHPNLRNLQPEKIREEMEKTQKEIKKACGILPMAIRFPYGISSSEVARIAYELHLDPFFWSIETNDYQKETTSEDIIKSVLKDVKSGSIILMHDKTEKVVETVKGLIDPIREKGYKFVTCSELAAEVRMHRNMIEKKDPEEGKNEQSLKGGEKK